ncbi:response regulator transcription factor [Paraflavisolibacter sp. H34]|uniref:LytR/AlgR family response regulator transcription factor n=1 Tax=Huijunlia imazamoxiresistens TaxID=3127457 RepID=UPI0030160D6A
MQIKCIAIDDEPLALEVLKQYIARIPVLQLVHTFNDPIAGSEFLRHHPVDLLFLDINMPDINGLELVRLLPVKPMVIFTTAHKEFALEGFELDALDYLLKPFEFERFAKAVNKAVEYYQYKKSEKPEAAGHLFVRSEYQLVKIELEEIEYIESVEDYLKIHRSGQKPVMTLMTLKAMLQKLPQDRFVRIHRSYVVPLARIRSIVNRKVRLSSVELPLSDSYAAVIKNWKGK